MPRKTEKYKKLTECSCNMIRKSARKVTQFYEDHLCEVGIKPTQFSILATLANTGPIQLTQLATQLLLERTGLTRNLNILERNGWVDLQIGEEDTRQRVVSLTEQGYKQLDTAIPYWEKAQKTIEKEMGRGVVSRLRKTLVKITKVMAT